MRRDVWRHMTYGKQLDRRVPLPTENFEKVQGNDFIPLSGHNPASIARRWQSGQRQRFGIAGNRFDIVTTLFEFSPYRRQQR